MVFMATAVDTRVSGIHIPAARVEARPFGYENLDTIQWLKPEDCAKTGR